MKCIYCNLETDLTSSDIITYAITGAKLTKSFVCKTHNAFTNDNYEKKFVADLDFFRNNLNLTTRNGKPIKYKADISVDGTEMHNVIISNKESLFNPRGVVVGTNDKGNKVYMATSEKIEKISKIESSPVDISNVIVHKTISSDSFLGFHALHSIAKIAYEWYCYINMIEEYRNEYNEIVDYILGKKEGDFVELIIEKTYYDAIDKLSEIGTNSFFQYDDIDGNRYVVFNFWNVISYRIKICESPDKNSTNTSLSLVNIFLYHIDGNREQKEFLVFPVRANMGLKFSTTRIQNVSIPMWDIFAKRAEKIVSTMVLTIHKLKKEVDELSSKLEMYDTREINVAQLLGFEEKNVITTIYITNQLNINKEKYDNTKSFNHNLTVFLKLDCDTMQMTEEMIKEYVQSLLNMDKENKLSEYIWKGINTFNKIYEIEMKK